METHNKVIVYIRTISISAACYSYQAAGRGGGLLSVEPYTVAEQPPTPDQLRALMDASDIFSPNELEATSMVGPGESCVT